MALILHTGKGFDYGDLRLAKGYAPSISHEFQA